MSNGSRAELSPSQTHSSLETSPRLENRKVILGYRFVFSLSKQPVLADLTLEISCTILNCLKQPSVGSELANTLVAQFLTKEIDAAEIIYTRFVNMITCEPSIRTLLPLSLSGIESEEDECFKVRS